MLLYSASKGDWPAHVLLISKETRTYTCTVVLGSAGRENTTADPLRGLWRSAPIKMFKTLLEPWKGRELWGKSIVTN